MPLISIHPLSITAHPLGVGPGGVTGALELIPHDLR